MTRCSDIITACAITCAPLAAQAQVFVADAFGLYMPGSKTGDRAQWSGVLTEIGAGFVRQTDVAPGPAETVIYILGPKRLIAGKDKGNGVAIVLDTLGNTVRDGEEVRFRVSALDQVARTNSGIASFLFMPPVQAGQYFSGAATANRQSTRAEIMVISDIGSITPAMVPRPKSPFTPESLYQIQAGDLADRFGNRIEDGIAMNFGIHLDDDSFALAGTVTQQGLATADLLTRDIAGHGQVTANLAARKTVPQDIAIATPVGLGPAEITLVPLPDINASRLRIGPFRMQDGYVLNDGSAITVAATDADGTSTRIQGWLLNGYFETLLPAGSHAGPVSLEVTTSLGIQHKTLMPAKTAPNFKEVME